ncbi:Aste57867_1892 [Aphanomyces stellatus]|uniref:Aste57867_1892 protein n=1 Tax=Aphanomyces stellatus TaxID=120398 RepID=A0A485K6U9_9STRA|nr:hypothetical protein As57867_001890 [Aphanomyces stellatus]VFT79099.1 Aste57867_1892 [Aphanomyces stellatus]
MPSASATFVQCAAAALYDLYNPTSKNIPTAYFMHDGSMLTMPLNGPRLEDVFDVTNSVQSRQHADRRNLKARASVQVEALWRPICRLIVKRASFPPTLLPQTDPCDVSKVVHSMIKALEFHQERLLGDVERSRLCRYTRAWMHFNEQRHARLPDTMHFHRENELSNVKLSTSMAKHRFSVMAVNALHSCLSSAWSILNARFPRKQQL